MSLNMLPCLQDDADEVVVPPGRGLVDDVRHPVRYVAVHVIKETWWRLILIPCRSADKLKPSLFHDVLTE